MNSLESVEEKGKRNWAPVSGICLPASDFVTDSPSGKFVI